MKIMPNKEAFQERHLKQPVKPHAFEKALLDVTYEKTPKDLGDWYYREHLESLQISHLQFNAPKVIKNQIEDASKTEVIFEKSTSKEISPIDKKIQHIQGLIEKNNPSIESFEPSFNKTKDNFSLPMIKPQMAFHGAAQKMVNTPKAHNAVLEKAFKTCVHYKNHQLFIENGQVELTLNLQNTHPSTLKPLLIEIETWLKNNHLRLRKFILNGVQR